MRNGNRCEGVIFDMDGVLIDSHPVHKKAWSRLLASLNKPASEEELDFVMEGRKREEILRHFLGDLSPEQIQEYGRLKNDLYRESEGDLRVVSGVVEFLDSLQAGGIRMAVATSASSPRAHDILDLLGLLSRFRAVVTANDVGRGKPDPEIYVRAANQLNIVPRNVLVVEDAISGVMGAKSAGMKCLGIAGNGRRDKLREAGADCVITDYHQISLSQVQQLF
jgi:HAD superfamily hydrolase (TIGR01509 family)